MDELSIYPPSQPFRDGLRVDVDTLYRTACCCSREDVATLATLSDWVAAKEPGVNIFDVLAWAIGRLGGDKYSDAARALLGVDQTRGWKQQARWKQAATALEYKTADSFRNSKQNGRRTLEVILDNVATQLSGLAEEHGIITSRHVERFLEDCRDSIDGISNQPVAIDLGTGTVLARSLSDAYLGDAYCDVPFIPKEESKS